MYSIRRAHTLGASAKTYGSFTSHSAVSWVEHTEVEALGEPAVSEPWVSASHPWTTVFAWLPERYHCLPNLAVFAQSFLILTLPWPFSQVKLFSGCPENLFPHLPIVNRGVVLSLLNLKWWKEPFLGSVTTLQMSWDCAGLLMSLQSSLQIFPAKSFV